MNRKKIRTRLSLCRSVIRGMVERGWSQAEIAEVMGCGAPQLSLWMKEEGIVAAKKCKSRGERFIEALERRIAWDDAICEANIDEGYAVRLYKLWENEQEQREDNDRIEWPKE